MTRTHVVEYGGSVVCPSVTEEGLPQYCKEGATRLLDVMQRFPDDRFIFIVGGGALASWEIKQKENEVRNLFKIPLDVPIDQLDYLQSRHLRHSLDYFGIKATHENANAVIGILQDNGAREKVCPEVITNPFEDLPEIEPGVPYSAYIAGGFKPGATTDAVAAYFAEVVPALVVHKLTNFQYVKDVEAHNFKKGKRYPRLINTTFDHMASLAGDRRQMVPGGSYALDPKAAALYKSIVQRPGMGGLVLNIGEQRFLERMIAAKGPQEWTVVRKDEI